MAKFYPVIHVHNFNTTDFNCFTAKDNGADGVFLINHNRLTSDDFRELAHDIILAYQDPNFQIGINVLGHSNTEALSFVEACGAAMLWSDNAGTDELEENELLSFYVAREASAMTFFGGVQFKYQPKPKWDIEESIRRALPWVDVPTLSGAGTGLAADLEFIKRAFDATDGNKPLAIASGIDEKNVKSFLPYIEHFLVASSIIKQSSPVEVFDKERLKKLCELIHSE